jgi:hypothetical protein
MADRNFNRKQALEREVKNLFAKVTIGSSGAPTLTTGYGFASISRTSTGLYVLTLQDKYASLKAVNIIHMSTSAEDLNPQVKSEDVVGAKTITFFTLAGGSVADPASGDVLLISVALKNTTVI